jgi:hypothetical protein
MEMYLAGVPLYTIMLISRWSSDAFLRYIRRQVERFSKDVAQKMLTQLSLFSTNQSTMQKQLIEEASSSRLLKGVGRGES